MSVKEPDTIEVPELMVALVQNWGTRNLLPPASADNCRTCRQSMPSNWTSHPTKRMPLEAAPPILVMSTWKRRSLMEVQACVARLKCLT